MSVAREKLYEEVWAEPMTHVAKRYGVSSVYLARICEQLGVPRPPRGYWQQLAVGVKVERVALPDADPGGALEWVRDGHEPRRKPPVAPIAGQRLKQRTGERPDKHPLLVGARAHFKHAREARDNEYVRSFKRSLVDIFVSREALERALKVASELYLALEDRGQRVVLAPSTAHLRHVSPQIRPGEKSPKDYLYSAGRWAPSQPTVTFVGEVAIGLTLFEISEEVEARYDSKLRRHVRVEPAPTPAKPTRRRTYAPVVHEWRSKQWLPSGRLGLHAFAPYHRVEWEQYWYETAEAALPSLFGEIAKQLERAAPKIAKLVAEAQLKSEEEKREREAAHVVWLKQMEESQLREAEKQRREAEARREREFEATIARWRVAHDIRAYVTEARALVQDAKLQLTPGGETERHFAWAAAYADKVDPLRGLRLDIASVLAEQEARLGDRPAPKALPETPPGPAPAREPDTTDGAHDAPAEPGNDDVTKGEG
jgi:hypothetical protein